MVLEMSKSKMRNLRKKLSVNKAAPMNRMASGRDVAQSTSEDTGTSFTSEVRNRSEFCSSDGARNFSRDFAGHGKMKSAPIRYSNSDLADVFDYKQEMKRLDDTRTTPAWEARLRSPHRSRGLATEVSTTKSSGRCDFPKSPSSVGSSPYRAGSFVKSRSFSRLERAFGGTEDGSVIQTDSSNVRELTEEEIASKHAELDYFQLAREMRAAVPVRDRMSQKLAGFHSKTFLASHAIRYLRDIGLVETAAEALYICDELISQGHMYDALDEDETSFKTGYRLYRFSADDRVSD